MKEINVNELAFVTGGGKKDLVEKAVRWAANTAAGAAATEVAKKAYKRTSNSVRRWINEGNKGTDCGTRNNPCG